MANSSPSLNIDGLANGYHLLNPNFEQSPRECKLSALSTVFVSIITEAIAELGSELIEVIAMQCISLGS